jgi:hypothetical protein
MNALRDAGFTAVDALCLYKETAIGAVAQSDTGPPSEAPIVACIVARGPGPPDEGGDGPLVADNVACDAPGAVHADVRSILDGLPG